MASFTNAQTQKPRYRQVQPLAQAGPVKPGGFATSFNESRGTTRPVGTMPVGPTKPPTLGGAPSLNNAAGTSTPYTYGAVGGGAPPRPAPGYVAPTPTAKGDDEVAHKMTPGMGTNPTRALPQQRTGTATRPNTTGRMGNAKPATTMPVPTQPQPVADDGNLLESTFLPGNDPRLQNAQGATDQAMQRILDADPYSTQAEGNADRYRKVFGSGDVQASDMGSMPDRTALAKQALADFDTAGERALEQRFRRVGQKNAALGRLGSGMVTTELGDIQSDFERDRMMRENELARGVAEGDIGDRFRRVDYETGLAERNQDRGFDRARSAIDYGGRDADRDISGAYDEFGAAGSLEDRIFGQGQSNRNEYRTERGFQEGRRQQSLEERIRQRELENAEREAEFRRSYLQTQAGRA